MGTLHNKKNKKKGSIIPLILGGLLVFAIIIGIGYMYSLQCNDGEEMIEGKCLVKCADGQTRVADICTTPTSSTLLICKDDEEKVGDKCLIKCTDGQTRVGVVCKLVCKDGEEMIGDKCLVKCEDGKVRVAGVCRTPTGSTPTGSTPTTRTPTGSTPTGSTPTGSTPIVVQPEAILTKFIEFTRGVGQGNNDWYINIAEIFVSVRENGTIRTLTADDYSSAECDRGDNNALCTKYPPSSAIDGNINNFAHTNNFSPKLLFTLKDAKDVVEVVVINRQDCCQHRIELVTLTLYTSNMGLVKQCALSNSINGLTCKT